MFSSFSEEKFMRAIEEKDYEYLKTCVINAIRNNPRFSIKKGEQHSEARQALDILKQKKERLPELFQSYKLFEEETPYDETRKTAWTEEYFMKETFYLGENFNEKRFNQLINIGQTVYPRNFTEPQESVLPQGESHEEERKSNVVVVKKHSNVKIGVLVIALVVILVAALLVVNGRKDGDSDHQDATSVEQVNE